MNSGSINITNNAINGINLCYVSPLNIKNTNQISCLECINNKFTWYLNPICSTDYVKLIGSSYEPFYLRIR